MVQKSGDHQLRLVFYLIINRVLAPSQVVVSRISFPNLTAAGTKMTSLAFSLGGMDRPALYECRGADTNSMQNCWCEALTFKYFKIPYFTASQNQLRHGIFGTKLAGRMEFPTFPLRMTMSFSQKHLKRIFIKAWHVQLSKESSMVAWLVFSFNKSWTNLQGHLSNEKKHWLLRVYRG